MHRNESYRIAATFGQDDCVAVAGYRIQTMFHSGRMLYVDDLVTTAGGTSRGYGKKMIAYLAEVARREGCESVQLDSATWRMDAHRFSERESFEITSFHFRKELP